jgi:hypothetical protein
MPTWRLLASAAVAAACWALGLGSAEGAGAIELVESSEAGAQDSPGCEGIFMRPCIFHQ